jgi:hypothetical protein
LVEAIGYCGLVCKVCKNTVKPPNPCKGCRSGGGDPNCFQRICWLRKGIEGCWECKNAPCEYGYFAPSNEAWTGICRGFIQFIKKVGLREFIRLVENKLGRIVEYGDFRFKTEQEIIVLLCESDE